MNAVAQIAGVVELRRQAGVVRALGSPFVANVLEAGHRQLGRAPRTAALFAGWPSDAGAAALAMRFNGALHALARRGTPTMLAALYQGQHDDYDGAIGAALASEDDFIVEWMRTPPQTNEVGRAAAIGAALMVAWHRYRLPFELLELGSSCGLNLNLARYGYTLGKATAGVPGSPVQIGPLWRGPEPAVAPIEVLSARGVDLNPLDPKDSRTRERLLSFIWADQPQRAQRLEAALAIAAAYPPQVDRENAVPWLAARLASPQEPGICRVVFHSMVLQYLSPADHAAIVSTIRRAGARTDDDTPLAWIGLEWNAARTEVQLTLTCWPDGGKRLLAICHPYGDSIDWLAQSPSLA